MKRIDLDERVPAFTKAMYGLDRALRQVMDDAGFDAQLRELVRVRASQLNGCAYCVDMHTKDARAAGETEQRLYALPVWRETPYFSDRERAALALTEAVTRSVDAPVSDEVVALADAHFDEDALAALISLIVTINAWNLVGVTTRAWEPGSYRVREQPTGDAS